MKLTMELVIPAPRRKALSSLSATLSDFPTFKVRMTDYSTRLGPLSEDSVRASIGKGVQMFRLQNGMLYLLGLKGALRNRKRLYVIQGDAPDWWLNLYVRDTTMQGQHEAAMRTFDPCI